MDKKPSRQPITGVVEGPWLSIRQAWYLERVALAEAEYRARTGRDIWDVGLPGANDEEESKKRTPITRDAKN
jgi:hypothetical protein